MKKSKLEIALEAYKLFLRYLDHHKIQGRILAIGLSASLFVLSCIFLLYILAIYSENLIKIIVFLK